MTVINPGRPCERTTTMASPEIGGTSCLQPCAPRASGRFLPARPVRWLASTALAVLATAMVGVAIPWAMESLVQSVLAPLQVGPMMSWIRPTLWAGYALFVVLVVLPFLIFLAWSRVDRRGG